MFVRPCVNQSGMDRLGRVGEGWIAMPRAVINAAAGAQTVTVDQIMGGAAVFTGAAGAVTYTTATAADLIAAMPDMDIGDTYVFSLTNTAAQAATLAGGTGVTIAGFTAANAQTRFGILQRTAAATITITFI